MAIPPNAYAFPQPLDPSDIADFQVNLSQGDTQFLQTGENVVSYMLVVTAEAVAAGLTIKTSGEYATILVGTVIRFWASIDPGYVTSPAFNGAGVAMPIELTVVTDATPRRQKQRTLVITGQNQ